jgi:protein-S-isoprenylcysteine O-methyltransferase Ste14
MNLNNRVPPPLVAILAGIIIYSSTKLISPVTFKFQGLIAVSVLVIGLTIMLSAINTFRQLQTTINPLKPKQATKLATNGVFKLTRNPMYLAMLIILIAFSVATGALAGLLLVPGFMLYITYFQILPEERAMAELFPDQFTRYCERVRRWL